MYIKSFSAEQFAGLVEFNSDKSKKFIPGMNVVVGNNEAGKSTMISGILRTLTMTTSLDSRNKEHIAFKAESLPTDNTNVIDAEVVFEDEGSEYSIQKVWNMDKKQASSKLKKTGGKYLLGAEAENELHSILKYGPAVYENLIFGRQADEQAILDWCSSFFGENTSAGLDETRNVIASAVSAAGGMSPEKIRGRITAAINEMYDNYWEDLENDMPKINRNNTVNGRYEKGVKKLLQAFYAWQDACSRLKEAAQTGSRLVEIDELLTKLDSEEKEYRERNEQKQNAEKNKTTREILKNSIEDIKGKLSAAETASTEWPKLILDLSRAQELSKLSTEKQDRDRKAELKSKLDEIAAQKTIIEASKETADRYPNIKTDIENARKDAASISKIDGALSAVLLNAEITLEDGYKAIVTGSDGVEHELSCSGDMALNGFVKISIPGVATIQVAPKDLNVAEMLNSKEKAQQNLDKILSNKYRADSIEKLEEILDSCNEAASNSETALREIKRILAGETEDEILNAYEAIDVDESIVIADDIDSKIRGYLDGKCYKSLDAAEAGLESRIEMYTAEYSSQEALPSFIKEIEGKLEAAHDSLNACPEVEFEDDGTDYDEKLGDISAKRLALAKEQGRLSSQENNDIEGLESDREEKWADYQRLKEEYWLYNKMLADFENLAKESGDKFDGFYAKFNEYLSLITDGRVSMVMNGKKASLMSGDNRIEIGALLSEGTKRTVLLAFRLAVLDYFYPDGGGMIVLDDDLIDMDPGRQEQAAKLLSRFAENNQVIVTTCSPAIAELLGGNRIQL